MEKTRLGTHKGVLFGSYATLITNCKLKIHISTFLGEKDLKTIDFAILYSIYWTKGPRGRMLLQLNKSSSQQISKA